MLVISGDTDGVVPTLSSRSWVESLGLPVKQALRPWVDAATGEVSSASFLHCIELNDPAARSIALAAHCCLLRLLILLLVFSRQSTCTQTTHSRLYANLL